MGVAIVMLFVGYTLKAHDSEAGTSWGEAALWGLALLGFWAVVLGVVAAATAIRDHLRRWETARRAEFVEIAQRRPWYEGESPRHDRSPPTSC